MSNSNVYEYNNKAISVSKSKMMTPASNHISVKYHWLRQYVGKKFVIRKIESEIQKAYIFTEGLQSECFARIGKLLCGW